MPAKLGNRNPKHTIIATIITLLNLLYHFHYFLFTNISDNPTEANDKRSFTSNQTSRICPPIRPKNSFEVPTPFNLNKYKPKIADYSSISVCERPWKNNRVFLLETRQNYVIPNAFCTLESLAVHMGKNWCVTLFVLKLDHFKNSEQMMKLKRTHSNIQILNLSPDDIVKGGPFDGIFQSLRFLKSTQKDLQVIHYSEILKAALLYNYGGIFLDLDTIALKSLDLAPEFLVRNANGQISNSLMKFRRWSFMLLRYVSNIWTDFSPENYGKMDFILSGVVEDHCKHMLKDVRGIDMSDTRLQECDGVSILGHKAQIIAPFAENHVQETIFNRTHSELFQKILEQSGSSLLHYAGHLNGMYDTEIHVRRDQSLYAKLFRKQCPLSSALFDTV